MSEANVELTRRYVDAFNARDIEAMIAYFHPSVEFHSAFATIGGAVYHGHDGLRSWHRDYEQIWGEELRNEPEAYFDLGEHALVFSELHGRGHNSGAKVAMPLTLVARSRDGLIVYFKVYIHRDDALQDLGVSEDELRPIEP